MNDINKTLHEINNNISEGKYKKALSLLLPLQNCIHKSPIIAYNFGGLAIDIGSESNDLEILDLGITVIEELISNLDNADRIYPKCCYIFASGLSSKLQYNQHFEREEYFAGDELAEKAKIYFRKVFDLIEDTDPSKPKAWVNYGNLLNGRLGRSLEALEAFQNAINLSPNFPMALANLGYTESLFANVIGGDAGVVLLHDSYHFIKKALNLGLGYGPRNYFKKIKADIYHYFSNKEFLEKEAICSDEIKPTNNEFEDFYRKFCQKERLYLNPLGINHKCEGALYDPITIQKFLIEIKKGDEEFFKFSSYINQVKQEYISARFLAAQSFFKNPNYKFIDDGVVILNTLDYSIHNIYLELGKLAFRSSYSILDKIAFIANDYFQLGMNPRYIFFQNLSPLKNPNMLNIKPITNPFLSAIIDLANDFYNDYFKEWKELRHAFEHRFKAVHLDYALPRFPLAEEINEKQLKDREYEMIKISFLKNNILEILRVVKAAIFYVTLMIDWEERLKINMTSDQFIAPMLAYQLPDDLKYD